MAGSTLPCILLPYNMKYIRLVNGDVIGIAEIKLNTSRTMWDIPVYNVRVIGIKSQVEFSFFLPSERGRCYEEILHLLYNDSTDIIDECVLREAAMAENSVDAITSHDEVVGP